MKVCAKCGGEFKNRGSRFCSTECSGVPSRNRRHGLCETPEYNSWTSMRERCNNKNRPAYQSYGAKGIKYCERWEVFENFLEDMGPRPSPSHTLERVDNSGNYEPGNCKWATKAEQSANRSCCFTPRENNTIKTLLSLGKSPTEIAHKLGRSPNSIYGRIRRMTLSSFQEQQP